MKKSLKLYHGIIVIVLAAVDIFILGGFLGMWFGLYGTAIGELILLGLAVGVTALAGSNFRVVFPFHKPKWNEVLGTLVFWFGVYGVTMMMTMIIAYFFPEQIMGVSAGLSEAFVSVPFLASFLIVAISPAICEEAVFRGVFFNSLWNKTHKKWMTILIVAVVFAAFHGNIWRFPPTFVLGIAMGYLMFETNNMFCNMLFHAINNGLPLILLFAMEFLTRAAGMEDFMAQAENQMSVPLMSVGIYMLYGCVAVFLVYLGRYLLHFGRPGYSKSLFPKEKRKELWVLIGICAVLAIVGLMVIVWSFVTGEWMEFYQFAV